MRDFRMIVPSPRRSTAMSRFNHWILRKAGFSSTVAAFPSILRLPKYRPLADSLLSSDIDRLSLFKEGPDAFAEIFGAAAQHLVAVFHRNRSLERRRIHTHVEAFLRQPQTDRRGCQHRLDIGLGGGFKAALPDDLRDETHR